MAFHEARAFLWSHRDDYDGACRGFRWPELAEFNWALDHFDAVAADPQRGARRARRRCSPRRTCGTA